MKEKHFKIRTKVNCSLEIQYSSKTLNCGFRIQIPQRKSVSVYNPFVLRKIKSLRGFGQSECNRVNTYDEKEKISTLIS